MTLSSNLLELPVGSTFKVKDDNDVWTVEDAEDVGFTPWEGTIPCSYPNPYVAIGKTYDCVYLDEIEKVLLVPFFDSTALPQARFVTLPDDFNHAIVELAKKFDRTVVFEYQKPALPKAAHVVLVSAVNDEAFGGSDATRDHDYRQFRFDRVVSEIELA